VGKATYDLPEFSFALATMNTFDVALLADVAPQAVNSFVFLADEGFYDGLTFHRIVEGFVIQGGDPLGDGTGGPGSSFDIETSPERTFDAPGLLAYANGGPGHHRQPVLRHARPHAPARSRGRSGGVHDLR
jgi:cyclophilin family peptidyl-prolyl cis-trans isomerase